MTNPTWQPPTLTSLPKEIAEAMIHNERILEVYYNPITNKWVRHSAKSYCYHKYYYGGEIRSITFTLKQ